MLSSYSTRPGTRQNGQWVVISPLRKRRSKTWSRPPNVSNVSLKEIKKKDGGKYNKKEFKFTQENSTWLLMVGPDYLQSSRYCSRSSRVESISLYTIPLYTARWRLMSRLYATWLLVSPVKTPFRDNLKKRHWRTLFRRPSRILPIMSFLQWIWTSTVWMSLQNSNVDGSQYWLENGVSRPNDESSKVT